jgi:hypothetical protein
MSIAFTKKVATKGMIKVSQGQCAAIAIPRAAAEMKKRIQKSPFDLRFTSIEEIFAKIGERSEPQFFTNDISDRHAAFCIFAG